MGSHLAEYLLGKGHQVTVVDNFSTGNRDNLAHNCAHSALDVVECDVLDCPQLEEMVAECDHIYHLAAAVGVKLIMERPVETLMTNVRGTEVVLELASRYGKKVLLASTSEVYGKAMEVNGHSEPLSEDNNWTLGPTSKRRWAYGCSKALDEFLALAYFDEKHLPVVIARYFNTVGPRQTGRYGMVIPNLVRCALLNQPILVHGDGEQSRSFTHVSDSIRATVSLMDCAEAVGQVFNIGNGNEIAILDLAERVREMTGSKSEIRHVPYEDVYGAGFEDMRRRTPNIEKIRRLIGFEPEFDLDRILADVIADIGSHLNDGVEDAVSSTAVQTA